MWDAFCKSDAFGINNYNESNNNINTNINTNRNNKIVRKIDLNATPHKKKRAAPTPYETTKNLNPALLAVLQGEEQEFNNALFSKQFDVNNNDILPGTLPVAAIDAAAQTIDEDGDNDDDDEGDEAILDKNIWKEMNDSISNSKKGDKWENNEVDKLCLGICKALKSPKKYGKPGSSVWWRQVTKIVNNRTWSGNKTKYKDIAKDKKAYRHSEMPKFMAIIENRRSSSATCSHLKEIEKYTQGITKRKEKKEKQKQEKEKKEEEFHGKRDLCLDLISMRLKREEEEEQKAKMDMEAEKKKQIELENEEMENTKKGDVVIKEIKNICDDLEDASNNNFKEEDLEMVRDATYNDCSVNLKREFLRLKERYNGDMNKVFMKLIREAKRMLK